MEIEIYADVIFLINFIMDFFIFWLMNKIIKKVHIIRLLVGSLAAALSYCLLIFFRLDNPLILAFFMFFSISVCFAPRSVKEAFKLFFAFVLLSFFTGGVSTGIFYFLSAHSIYASREFSLKFLVLGSAVMYILIKIAIACYKKSIMKKQVFYKVTLYHNKEKTTLNALADTGNSLREPLTKTPVIIAEYDAVKNILPAGSALPSIENIFEFSGKIPVRVIPFSAVGIEHGLLVGFSIEKAEILTNTTITIKNAVVAVYDRPLSKNGSYNALLNPELLIY